MKLYHGSDTRIETIDLELCKPFKDFGKGFYLSADYDQAHELAKIRATFSEREPVVNGYEFDEAILSDTTFRIKTFDSYTEEWARFVLDNSESNRHTQKNLNMDKTFNFLKEGIATDLAGMLVDRFGLSVREALDALYSSKTYTLLSDKATRLYTQSPLYVFTFLEDEIRTGRFITDEI